MLAGRVTLRCFGFRVSRSPYFPSLPERDFYNNALLDRGLTTAGFVDAVDATEATYAAARIEKFALWVHESDAAAGRHLERRGYAIDTVTRAMGMRLDGIRMPRPAIDFGDPDWSEYAADHGSSGPTTSVRPIATRNTS